MQKKFLALALFLVLFCSLVFARGGGGCFTGDALISTPFGEKKISSLSAGDEVFSYALGNLVPVKVLYVYKTTAEQSFVVSTKETSFEVTGEHLIAIDFGEFKQAKNLVVGDKVLVLVDGKLEEQIISSITLNTQLIEVYNLLVDKENLFFANNVLVHNKGCFLPDTNILLSDGSLKAISSIGIGDKVKAFDYDGKTVNSVVNDIYSVNVNEYFILRTNGGFEVKVTAEHPFFVGNGIFKTVEELKVDDNIFVYDGYKLLEDFVNFKETVSAPVTVYNLKTDSPNTFFANFTAVHNKGGGGGGGGGGSHGGSSSSSSPYSSGTFCGMYSDRTINGQLIEGKECIYVYYLKTNASSITALSSCASTSVNVFVNCSQYLSAAISNRLEFECRNTENCPGGTIFTLEGGKSVTVTFPPTILEKLSFYGVIVLFALTFITLILNFIFRKNKFLSKAVAISFFSVFVFTLFAGLLSTLLHGNLGLQIIAIIILLIIIFSIRKKIYSMQVEIQSSNGDLDFCYPATQIDSKASKTAQVINYLAGLDKVWKQEFLETTTKDTFLLLQKCWQSREYSQMEPLLMRDLYLQHLTQIAQLWKDHEVDKLDDMKINKISIINVRYAGKEAQQEFTAIIDATVTDYYVDDQNGKFIRGDRSPATFQEFWVFQRVGTKWLLREIDQTSDSNALREENFVEQLTPEQMKKLYASAKSTSKDGEEVEGNILDQSAPWMDAGLELKSNKIYRMLNFQDFHIIQLNLQVHHI